MDSDNNDANSTLTVNNGANAEVFKIDETGQITIAGRISGLLTPINDSDAATKAYVDAAAGGGGDATLSNQEVILDNQTTIIGSQTQILSETQGISR
jgi:hypothetical protein